MVAPSQGFLALITLHMQLSQLVAEDTEGWRRKQEGHWDWNVNKDQEMGERLGRK